jgi:succinate dehydrogenase / fumarate reductase cytochrome b subunit
VHGYEGIRVTLQNWKARPGRYAVKPKDPQSTIASRTMWLSASIIFIFLVIHLQNFWYLYKSGGIDDQYSMYQAVVDTFQNPVYSAIYLAAILLMGFHLWHGFQSSFQTMGWNHSKYMPMVVMFGRIYTIIICAGFASFPIYFYFIYGRH